MLSSVDFPEMIWKDDLCSLPKLLCLDNDDYDDLDEAKSTVSSVAVGRKRNLSTSTGATSTAGPAMKYQGKVD